MLPFNRRSGRAGEANTSSTPVAAPPSSARPALPSMSDDEITACMTNKTLGGSRSGSLPRPSRPPIRPSAAPPSMRQGLASLLEPIEEDCTVIRSQLSPDLRTGPQPRRRLNVSTPVSQASVIKASLESTLSSQRLAVASTDYYDDHGPPSSSTGSRRRPSQSPSMQAQPYQYAGNPAVPGGAPSSTFPPPPSSGVGSVPPVVVSAPVPAHFMAAQPPYSDPRFDTPPTSVTAGPAVGRTTSSWAAALLTCGLLVGVGAIAVLGGSSDGLAEASASFVDPARAGRAAPPTTAMATATSRVAFAGSTTTDESAMAPPIAVPTTTPPVSAPPGATQAVVAQVAPQPRAQAAAPQTPQPPSPQSQGPSAPAQPQAGAAPSPAPTSATHARSWGAPAPRPAAAPPAPPKSTVAAAPTKPKATATEEDAADARDGKRAARPKGRGGDIDEETKKALEALQKSQLESSF